MTLADRILAYMYQHECEIYRLPGQLNIVYLEGVNADGRPNADTWGAWNDRRIVFDFYEGQPRILHNSLATTEPGKAPTFAAAAMRLGGIFRIQFGQHLRCWKMGFHKGNKAHPALVQIPGAIITGYRDRNGDGKRTGDLLSKGFGINQHGTRPGFVSKFVGYYSIGCLVAQNWFNHLTFIGICKTDPRYIADPDFAFSATVIAGDELQKLFPA